MKFNSLTKTVGALALLSSMSLHAQVDSTGVAPLRGAVTLAPSVAPPPSGAGEPWTKQFAGNTYYLQVNDGPNSAWWGFDHSKRIIASEGSRFSWAAYCGHTGYTNPGGGGVRRSGRRTIELYIHSDGSIQAWTLDQYSGARMEDFGRTYIPYGRDPVSLTSFNGSRGSIPLTLYAFVNPWDRTKVDRITCVDPYAPPSTGGGVWF